MTKKRVFTVGLELPGGDFEYVRFDSDQSLLDADIILFRPSFGERYPGEDYEGTLLFNKYHSPQVAQTVRHWRAELVAAANAGKVVIVFLAKPLNYYRYTGAKTYSGTGRSRVTTNHVEPIATYSAVPNIDTVEAKSGTEVRLTKDGGLIAPYWKDFGSNSPYEAFITGKFTNTLLTTKSGDRIVAAVFRGRGSLLFLPPVRFDVETLRKYDSKLGQNVWNADGLKFGKRLLTHIVAIADTLAAGRVATPPPEWAQASTYDTAEESDLHATIEKVSKDIERLQQKKLRLEQQLVAAAGLRGLLYEQGKPLEHAVRDALTLFGFTARPFQESDSEFDVVFESAEGRFIGEVEGKDTKAINIDKLSQLERNLQEDFAREEVSSYAKGILFGNAERLTEPSKRAEAFTVKCQTGAKRAGIALVRTPDLFEPARYLRSNKDESFAALCRQAIFAAAGAVAEFPSPPGGTDAVMVNVVVPEDAPAADDVSEPAEARDPRRRRPTRR